MNDARRAIAAWTGAAMMVLSWPAAARVSVSVQVDAPKIYAAENIDGNGVDAPVSLTPRFSGFSGEANVWTSEASASQGLDGNVVGVALPGGSASAAVSTSTLVLTGNVDSPLPSGFSASIGQDVGSPLLTEFVVSARSVVLVQTNVLLWASLQPVGCDQLTGSGCQPFGAGIQATASFIAPDGQVAYVASVNRPMSLQGEGSSLKYLGYFAENDSNEDQIWHVAYTASIYGWSISNVPELSSAALMGLGLVGVATASRRRTH